MTPVVGESAGFHYPVHYDLGDKVTATYGGVTADAKITEIALIAQGPSYLVRAAFDVTVVSLIEEPVVLAGMFNPGYIWRSTDDGVIWTMESKTGSTGAIYAFARAANGWYLAAGRVNLAARIFWSQDRGDTWTEAYQFAGEGFARCLCSAEDGAIYAGTGNSAKIWRSTDHGLTWTVVADIDVPGTTADQILELVEARDNSITAAAGRWVYGLCNASMWRSTDDGDSFSKVQDLENVMTPEELMVMSNGWLAMVLNTAAAARDPEFWVSTNDGASWAKRSEFVDSGGVFTPDLVHGLCQLSDGTLIAGGCIAAWNKAIIWRSTNLGITWTASQLGDTGEQYDVWDIIVAGDGHLLAGVQHDDGQQVWKSEDKGLTWTMTAVLSAGAYIQEMALLA